MDFAICPGNLFWVWTNVKSLSMLRLGVVDDRERFPAPELEKADLAMTGLLPANKPPSELFDQCAILRWHATEGRVWDFSNDTVVVTRALLTTSADEIERLRAAGKIEQIAWDKLVAERDSLRTALEGIVEWSVSHDDAKRRAQNALKPNLTK